MHKLTKIALASCISLAFISSAAWAGPKPDQVNRLSEDLTPTGATRAGNEDGTIPAWDGGITSPPAGYSVGDHHQDPFAADEVLFRIDASNVAEHQDKLSVGQVATINRYPDSYYMNVYPSRRSSSFPQHIYDLTAKNGATGRTTVDGEGVIDVAEGFPFPFPETD